MLLFREERPSNDDILGIACGRLSRPYHDTNITQVDEIGKIFNCRSITVVE